MRRGIIQLKEKKFYRTAFVASLLTYFFVGSFEAWAWTLRGHQVVCESAIYLVSNPTLRDFLKRRILAMGHLCNLPDFQWVSGPADDIAIGKSSHYIDMDVLGLPFSKIDLNYPQVIAQYRKLHPDAVLDANLYRNVGSVWWRANQFYNRAASIKPRFDQWVVRSEDGELRVKSEGKYPFADASYDFAVNLGLMGHFVGDNSQPYHLTEDSDGYGNGRGGIHVYYENDVVNALSEQLEGDVLKAARRLQAKKLSWIKDGTPVERMKKLSLISFPEIKDIEKWDCVLKKSDLKKNGDGSVTRVPAERRNAALMAPAIRPQVITELARSAVLLAQFWDEAYQKAGAPPLLLDTGFKYPITVDFIQADYLIEGSSRE